MFRGRCIFVTRQCPSFGLDVIRVRDPNKDLRLVDLVSRARRPRLESRTRTEREKGRLAGRLSIGPPLPLLASSSSFLFLRLSNGEPVVIDTHRDPDEAIVRLPTTVKSPFPTVTTVSSRLSLANYADTQKERPNWIRCPRGIRGIDEGEAACDWNRYCLFFFKSFFFSWTCSLVSFEDNYGNCKR